MSITLFAILLQNLCPELMMARKFIIILILSLVVAGLSFLNLLSSDPVTGFTNKWEVAVPQQEIPEGLISLSSKECGSCHESHYDEWQNSTHAMAWKDPQFQAEMAKESSPYMCINCHIPLQNQQEYVVTGLIDNDVYQPVSHKNPLFDQELQQEGINCAACHVRDGAVIGTTVSNMAPHKSIANKEFLSEQLCISCHNVVAEITAELVCSFETGDEWAAGPYFESKNCISCHMPQINRPITKDSIAKPGTMHYFMGSGIAKHDTLNVERLDGLEFSFMGIMPDYNVDDSIALGVVVTNKFAGHKVPTGDPERFILTILSIHELSTNAMVSQDTFRIGEEWIWYPEAKKITDNNLLPDESREYFISSKLPRGNYEFVLTSFKYRTTTALARYNKLPATYPTHIKFYEKRMAFEVK
jgi:nitrate/TMAO reductase-like tetraheme cytochrome c subunit